MVGQRILAPCEPKQRTIQHRGYDTIPTIERVRRILVDNPVILVETVKLRADDMRSPLAHEVWYR